MDVSYLYYGVVALSKKADHALEQFLDITQKIEPCLFENNVQNKV